MSEGRILVVEDDPTMQRLLRTQLAARGYDIQAVSNGPDAVTALADCEPDLMLLDIGLPGMDGLEVCRHVREWSEAPIILVSARDAPQTKALALELGADDYITKPFFVGELIARIHAVLRRMKGLANNHPAVVRTDRLTVDMARRQVLLGEERLSLTKTEFDLLQEFVRNADRVLTYEHLLNAVWHGGYDDPRLVQVHVCNLRRKLEHTPDGPRYIQTLPGIGYRFDMNGSAE